MNGAPIKVIITPRPGKRLRARARATGMAKIMLKKADSTA
jgi:hypothetical protein